jgi:excinuclease ABC subunit A
LDEPTTGLHFEDVRKLLEVLHRLADQGNTVVVIEHNLDVIKTADWVIDMGPGGGVNGGRIVVEGTPETVAATKESFTGQYLKPLLERASVQPLKPQPAKKSRKRASSEDQPDLIAAK